MGKKRNEKKIPKLEAFFESILVCNDQRLRPFIEVFTDEPENISQQNLGALLGIFDINESSEDSSYIANYLISVIRKEYFAKPKRSAIDSFEAALHKANLGLSKLAEHGNVKWIGKLNAIVAVIEKNNLHLSQSGTTTAFLLRAKNLTEISEGLASEESEPHPLKTFVNVSSGRLEDGDKLIISTENIFDIFSFDEIKKSALRFSNEKFLQFLKTALTNELEKAAVLVAEISEKIETEPASQRDKQELNAFSQSAFLRPSAPPVTEKSIDRAKDQEKEKNGHIYIKAGESPEIKSSIWLELKIELKEKTRLFFRWLWKMLRLVGLQIYSLLHSLIKGIAAKKNQPATNLQADDQPTDKESEATGHLAKKHASFLPLLKRFMPNFAKLRQISDRLNNRQKTGAFLIVLAIIILPLVILRMQRQIQKKTEPQPAETVTEIPLPLADDKNVVRLESIELAISGENIIAPLALSGKIFAVSQKSIMDVASQESFPLPENAGEIRLAAAMEDLGLLFLINQQNKILSWSVTAKKFQDNAITIPDNSSLAAAGTYLTYLYLVDRQNGQIYRYPRSEGGFGNKTDWLKENPDLSGVTGMALTDNILLATGSNLLKFFRGERQDFAIENTATPINPFKVFTRPESQSVYILDKNNKRVIQLDNSGLIRRQFYHPELGNAGDFTVDETNNKAYFSTTGNIFTFYLN